MLAKLKTLLIFLLAGAFLGLATASWLGPKWLEWDNTPGLAAASTQTMCDLPAVIRTTAAKLLHYQINGTLTGAALSLVLGVVYLVMRSRKSGPQAATPPPSPPRPAA